MNCEQPRPSGVTTGVWVTLLIERGRRRGSRAKNGQRTPARVNVTMAKVFERFGERN